MIEDNSENIDQILKKTILLLEKHNELGWCLILRKLLHQYYDPRFRDEAVRSIINTYKGGMGSFVDLVLQRNYVLPRGAPLKTMKNYDDFTQENDKFDALTTELYEACVEHLKNISE